MMRVGGWIGRHGPSAVIAGGLLATGCFFQPNLGGGGGSEDGTGTGTATSGGGAAASTEAEAPTSGEPTNPTSETSSGGAVCGDFEKDAGEECDDGEPNNGGGGVCKADCTLNVCGDGYLATALEGCDDGNTAAGDGCDATCKSEGCGDGSKGGAEECDDGNQIDDDQCSNLCRLPVCGDGIVNGEEQCDDPNGNSDTGACVSSCAQAVCGDGFVWDGVEACDDGNAVDDDACSNGCVATVCGDGVVSGAEACDDGNQVETDFCRNTCEFATCGDGVVQVGAEECDPPSPTCSAFCERTGFWVFLSSETMSGSQVGGTAQADQRCTALAAGTMVAGKYRAWLSSMDTAANRLEHAALPYVRPDGMVVANDWNSFASGAHLLPINVTEAGAALAANPPGCEDGKQAAVWTGTFPDGTGAQHCEFWTKSQIGKFGQGGLFNRSDTLWSGCSFGCNIAARLYCVEQP